MSTKLKYLLLCLAIACHKIEVPEAANGNRDTAEELSAGTGTIFDLSENAFGQQLAHLNSTGIDAFVLGKTFFRSNWTTAPASASLNDGLGPMLNATSCGSCHTLEGRGKPPVLPGEPMSSMVVRLSQLGAETHGQLPTVDEYGDQLSNHAIANVKSEGNVKVYYTERSDTYADGSSCILYVPHYTFHNMNYGMLGGNILFSPRLAQQIPGLGLLEAINENTILGFADADDLDKDGISGRPNYVWDLRTGTEVIGKFGWKANQPNIRQQVAAAFSGDIGITTTLFPNENLTSGQFKMFGALPNGGNPELNDDILQNVVFYISTLAVPARRSWTDPVVEKGKHLFNNIKCNRCHIPKITTGIHPQINELSNQIIRPYTDMLLHDMGDALADGRPDFKASGNEWKTPPLWGIGMIKTVNKKAFYLHDGRARTMEEAILWHGGEATSSASDFRKLNATERESLIEFLESL